MESFLKKGLVSKRLRTNPAFIFEGELFATSKSVRKDIKYS